MALEHTKHPMWPKAVEAFTRLNAGCPHDGDRETAETWWTLGLMHGWCSEERIQKRRLIYGWAS